MRQESCCLAASLQSTVERKRRARKRRYERVISSSRKGNIQERIQESSAELRGPCVLCGH